MGDNSERLVECLKGVVAVEKCSNWCLGSRNCYFVTASEVVAVD